MGDLIDSIFQRQCSLTDSKDRDRPEHGTDVTVLEVGAHKTVDTYQCQTFHDVKDYFDRKEARNNDPFWDEPSRMRQSCLRLFFLPTLKDGHTGMMPPAKGLPGLTEIFHEKLGMRPSFMGDFSEGEEDSVSPTSSPHRSALTTRSRRGRLALDGLDEDAVMTLQPQQDEPRQSWEWETRYTQSTTQTLADTDTTTYICMNFPQRLQKRISDTIHSLEALAKNPLFMDTLIIDEMIAFYRDAIKVHRSQLLAIPNDDNEELSSTDLAIKLEELAGHWRTILIDIQSIQTHIRHLRSVAETRVHRKRARTPPPAFPFPGGGEYRGRGRGHDHGHTRQKSSDVFGPPAGEILQLQASTCEFWSRCVNLYLDRTTDRISENNGTGAGTGPTTYRLRKTIPLRRRGSLPQLNRRLSNFTVEVAVQIQRNSSSVSTLALSFLSTIFFSPDGLIFAITYWWWILATLIVPLTFIVLHLGVETLASNTAFVRRRKAAQRLGGVAEEGAEGEGEEEGEGVQVEGKLE